MVTRDSSRSRRSLPRDYDAMEEGVDRTDLSNVGGGLVTLAAVRGEG